MRHPADDRTVRLLKMEKDAPWYDNVNTPAQETLNQVVAASFSRALDSLRQTYGPSGKKWQWGQVKGTHVPHLLGRSEEHTSELQSLMRISYAVFCLKKKKETTTHITTKKKYVTTKNRYTCTSINRK